MKNIQGTASTSEDSNESDNEQASATESENESEEDLAASSTSSDQDDSDEPDNTIGEGKCKADIIDEQIRQKYDTIKGTRLYVRFPKKLPADDKEFESLAKSLSPLIIKAHKPRQKHARFCLVEFNTEEDRDAAMVNITDASKTDTSMKGIFVSVPKTESSEFVNELVARKQQSLDNKKTKLLMKRATKKVKRKESFTTSVIITNLPKTSSVAQVRKLFENAVDIQIKPGKGKFRDFSAATVTLPTTHDARAAIKQKYTIGGTNLLLRFNTPRQRKTRQAKADLKRKLHGGDDAKKFIRNKKIKKTVDTASM